MNTDNYECQCKVFIHSCQNGDEVTMLRVFPTVSNNRELLTKGCNMAISGGHCVIVKHLIHYVTVCREHFNLAIINNYIDVLEVLFCCAILQCDNKQISQNDLDNMINYATYKAAWQGHVDMAKFLISKGASFCEAIEGACKNDQYEFIHFLLSLSEKKIPKGEKECDFNYVWSIWIKKSLESNLPWLVQVIIDRGGVCCVDEDDFYYACKYGLSEIVEIFINKGICFAFSGMESVCFNSVLDPRDKMYTKYLKIVQLIIEHEINSNKDLNDAFNLGLSISVLKKNYHMCKMLMNHGAHASSIHLIQAIRTNEENIVGLLLDQGAFLKQKDAIYYLSETYIQVVERRIFSIEELRKCILNFICADIIEYCVSPYVSYDNKDVN